MIFNPELKAEYQGEGAWERESNSTDENKGAATAKKSASKDEKKSSKDDKNAASGDKKGKEEEDESGYRLAKSEFVKGLRNADKQFHGKFFKHCLNLRIHNMVFSKDVWVYEKGLLKEGEPQKAAKTIHDLQEELFSTFGIRFSVSKHYTVPLSLLLHVIY